MRALLLETAVALMLPGIAGSALAAPLYSYPLAPEGSFVLLRKSDFVRWATNGWPGTGDNVGGHFGWITQFVGIFARPINPEGSQLYLWETTSAAGLGDDFAPFPGPIVTMGMWDGLAFYPVLESRQVTYEVTFAPGADPWYIISAAVVEIGPCKECNAVEVLGAGHAQVSAIATSVYLPEAGTGWLAGAGLVMLGLLRYHVPMRKTRPKLKRMPWRKVRSLSGRFWLK